MKIQKVFFHIILVFLAYTFFGCASIVSHKETSFSDTIITKKVRAQLTKADSQKFAGLRVTTQEGNVYLSGSATCQTDINSAMEISKRVEGVVSVKSGIVLSCID